MFARLIKISLLFTMQNHITMFLATQSYIFVKYCRMVKKQLHLILQETIFYSVVQWLIFYLVARQGLKNLIK